MTNPPLFQWFSRRDGTPSAVEADNYAELWRIALDQLELRPNQSDAEFAGQALAYLVSAAWRASYSAHVRAGDLFVVGGTVYMVGRPAPPHELSHLLIGGRRPVDVFDAYTITNCCIPGVV